MNVATGGFGTEITAQTDEGLKDKIGGAAYLLTGALPQFCMSSALYKMLPLWSWRLPWLDPITCYWMCSA